MKTKHSGLKIETKYRSSLDASIYEAANDLFEIGLISPQTMRQFDKGCLTEVTPLSPTEIADLRHHAGVSQSVFATYLNVTTGIVSKWERGEKHPAGPALKLLNLAKKKGLEAIA
jgi:putative transcriptional regulator